MTCKSYWPGNGNAEGLEVHLARQIEHYKLLTIDPGCLSSFQKTQKIKINVSIPQTNFNGTEETDKENFIEHRWR